MVFPNDDNVRMRVVTLGEEVLQNPQIADSERELAVAYAKLGRVDDCLDALENRARFALCSTPRPVRSIPRRL